MKKNKSKIKKQNTKKSEIKKQNTSKGKIKKQNTKKGKMTNSKRNWLISFASIILAGAIAVGIALPLVMCSSNSSKTFELMPIGNYDGASNPNIDHPIVYIRKNQNKNSSNVLRYMEIKVGSNLIDQFGCIGWTVFGTKIEALNGAIISTYNSNIDANTIPKNLLIDDTEKQLKNISFFKGNNITSIFVPDFIETISTKAFEGCFSLANLDLSKATSLQTIGENAFLGCYNLLTLDLLNTKNLKTIDAFAFANCSNLTGELIVPASLSSIKISSFGFSRQVEYMQYPPCHFTSINIEDGNTSFVKASNLGPNCAAIMKKESQANFDFSKEANKQIVSPGLFCGELEIPDTVPSIITSGFSGCSGLTSLNFDKATNLISIGENAFANCIGLSETLTIPGNVASIDSNAFNNCFNIKNLDLSNAKSLATIGESAFNGCSGLTNSLTIPANLTFIGDFAFLKCNFTTIEIDGGNAAFVKADNLGSNCVAILKNGQTSFDFSTTVIEQIPSYLICGELEISNSVTSISNECFKDCSALTGLNLTNAINLATIGSFAFQNCSSLTNNLTIPTNITYVGTNSFSNTNFIDVTFLQTNPSVITKSIDVFAKNDADKNDEIIIYVPTLSLNAWKTAEIVKALGIGNIEQIKSK